MEESAPLPEPAATPAAPASPAALPWQPRLYYRYAFFSGDDRGTPELEEYRGLFFTIFKRDWKVKLFVAALVFACLLIPIGTSTRTGLLCIGLLVLLKLRDSKRKFLYLGMIGVLGLAATGLTLHVLTRRRAGGGAE